MTFADGDEPRDSSAAAIAACGMLAMAPYLEKADDPQPLPRADAGGGLGNKFVTQAVLCLHTCTQNKKPVVGLSQQAFLYFVVLPHSSGQMGRLHLLHPDKELQDAILF